MPKVETDAGPAPEIIIICSVATWRKQVEAAIAQEKRFALIGPPLDADYIDRLRADHGLKVLRLSDNAVELWPE